MNDKKSNNNRVQQIDFLLNQVDKLHLRDASEILDVSEMTIRRDISSADSNLILLGGYIVRKSQKVNSYFLLEQQNKNISEKMKLGKLAASLIEDGDIVFFDCGTTVAFIASQIPESVKFTAVCCSINTFLILQENLHCDIILCGGAYSRDNALITSIQPQSIIHSVCTTKAFIATSGADPQYGLTCFKFSEAKIKQEAMMKTKQKILVFDHSKFNQVHSAYIGEMTDFDIVVCDKQIPEEFNIVNSKVITNT